MRRKSHLRNCHGAPIIEMVAGLIVVIPIILYLLDLLLYLWAVDINSMASRDAARAAACGPPTPYIGCVNRAKAVLSSYAATNFIKGPMLATSAGMKGFAAPSCPTCTNGGSTLPAPDPGVKLCCVNDPGGNGGQILGTVIVVTEMDLTLPVPFPFIDATQKLFAENQFSFTSVEASTNNPS